MRAIKGFFVKVFAMATALIAALVLAAAILLSVSAYDSRRFIVRQYTVTDARVTREHVLAFITDLHEKEYGQGSARLVSALSEAAPEAVLIGGDIVIARHAGRSGWLSRTRALAEALRGMCPVFFAMGNHEQRLREDEECAAQFDELLEVLRSSGVAVLDDTSASLGELRVYGLSLPMEHYRRFTAEPADAETVRAHLGGPDESAVTVLLAHNPRWFPAYAEWGADIVLSGHLHGGIMRLPLIGGVVSPQPALFPRYSGGEYRSGDGRSVMVLSCGMGVHTLPIRIFNPAELSIVRVVPPQS